MFHYSTFDLIFSFVSPLQRVKKLMQHDASFGPSQPKDREDWIDSLTGYELERYEAAQANLDVSRYQALKLRKSNAIYTGPVTTITMEPSEDHENSRMLVSGASNFTSLLNGDKDVNSVC